MRIASSAPASGSFSPAGMLMVLKVTEGSAARIIASNICGYDPWCSQFLGLTRPVSMMVTCGISSDSGARTGDLGLLAGDELQKHRHAFLRLLDAALDGGDDVLGLCDALAIAAKGARHRGIVAGNIGGAV